MTRTDRVKALLANKQLSYRAIAREVGCSDWTVRRIARDQDWSPMKSAHDEIVGVATWVGLAATVAAIGLTVWVRLHVRLPPETSSPSF
jgi:hypothetical protein